MHYGRYWYCEQQPAVTQKQLATSGFWSTSWEAGSQQTYALHISAVSTDLGSSSRILTLTINEGNTKLTQDQLLEATSPYPNKVELAT